MKLLQLLFTYRQVVLQGTVARRLIYTQSLSKASMRNDAHLQCYLLHVAYCK